MATDEMILVVIRGGAANRFCSDRVRPRPAKDQVNVHRLGFSRDGKRLLARAVTSNATMVIDTAKIAGTNCGTPLAGSAAGV